MSKIKMVNLEVYYRVGVTEEERARPQRLLLTVEMTCDFTAAALSDRLENTINYADVAQALLRYGEGRSWKLLEKLVSDLADLVLEKYQPEAVTVEVKKFPIPEAQYVSATLTRTRRPG